MHRFRSYLGRKIELSRRLNMGDKDKSDNQGRLPGSWFGHRMVCTTFH